MGPQLFFSVRHGLQQLQSLHDRGEERSSPVSRPDLQNSPSPVRHYFSNHGVEEKPKAFRPAFSIVLRQKNVLQKVVEVQGKDGYGPPCGVGSESLGRDMPSAEFVLEDMVDLLGLAAPLSLPPDDFLPVHGVSLPVAEDRSIRSVLYVGDDAEGFVDSPSKVQEVELFDSGDFLFKKPDGFGEVELVSGG